MIRVASLFIFVSLFFDLPAQPHQENKEIDSLKKALKITGISNEDRVKTLLSISKYYTTNNPKYSFACADSALLLVGQSKK